MKYYKCYIFPLFYLNMCLILNKPKTTTMKKAINILTFVCIFCFSTIAQTISADLETDLQKIVNNALPSKLNNPGVVLGIHVPGLWSWYGSAGYSITGLTNGYPAKTALSSDKFRVGSISKMFVSTAILQLEEAGMLSTNDDIALYLRPTLINDTIKNTGVIYIKNLLEHTSGVPDLANNDSCSIAAKADLTRNFTHEEAIFCGCVQGEEFPPGFTWGYSNTNYSLLSMIIEEVTGKPMRDYIKDNIIDVLGLNNTFYPPNDEISVSHMGCYWDLAPVTDFTIVDVSLYKGWADIVSNTEDLYTFFHALRTGTLINQNTYNKMFSISPISFDYGLGVEYFDINGDIIYGHSGDVGNTSGLFFVDISTPAFPDGYYMVYNYNYEGVDMINLLEVPLHNLMKGYVPSLTHIEERLEKKLMFYPNPSDGSFNIGLEKDGEYQLKIF
ncbi:MAG TPA: class A beta-lactamase-related serine hydrolase, partial [Bacteroidetes bacterium]|nr:class A beta-lactamase-related serine hydrolase [Bacteroidota bacterium]